MSRPSIMSLSSWDGISDGPVMERSLTDTLCTRCGLCCDGSLFADVELASRAEADGLELMGLEIEDRDTHGALLVQPCRALRGRRCSIYAHRPACCRTFECRLLQDARRGAVSEQRAVDRIEATQRQIARVMGLVAQLGQPVGHLPLRERCAEALAQERHADPEVNRRHRELEAAMAELTESIEKTFLAGVVGPRARRGGGRERPR